MDTPDTEHDVDPGESLFTQWNPALDVPFEYKIRWLVLLC